MRFDAYLLIGAALLVLPGCGDGGIAPPTDDEGRRLAAQFEQLADSVDSAGWSPTADALRHAAEIVRLTGHATPVTLTLDGAARSFLAVAEQIDCPNLVCTWPADSGTVEPDPGSETPPTPPSTMDSAATPPAGGTPGECTEVGVYSMRTFIAWEPDRMAEVVRLVADAGSNQVERGVPDVMTGLPTNAGGDDPPSRPTEPAPGDSAGGGGGSSGYPGFMGEYLVRDVGSWFRRTRFKAMAGCAPPTVPPSTGRSSPAARPGSGSSSPCGSSRSASSGRQCQCRSRCRRRSSPRTITPSRWRGRRSMGCGSPSLRGLRRRCRRSRPSRCHPSRCRPTRQWCGNDGRSGHFPLLTIESSTIGATLSGCASVLNTTARRSSVPGGASSR